MRKVFIFSLAGVRPKGPGPPPSERVRFLAHPHFPAHVGVPPPSSRSLLREGLFSPELGVDKDEICLDTPGERI
jgi:hypothetical protein